MIRIRQGLLGKHHVDTIHAQRSYGLTLWNLFEIRTTLDVQKCILNALHWSRPHIRDWTTWPTWKPIHVPYCLALNDITLTLWLAGKRHMSRVTGERAVDGLTKHLGPKDPQTLSAMFNPARTYFHLGEEHAYTLWSINGLSKVHSALGQPEKAVSTLEAILPVMKRILGESHVGTAMTQSNLGKAYFESGRWKDAETLVRQLLATIPSQHPGWIHNMYGYARVKFKIGRWGRRRSAVLKFWSRRQGNGILRGVDWRWRIRRGC